MNKPWNTASKQFSRAELNHAIYQGFVGFDHQIAKLHLTKKRGKNIEYSPMYISKS